MRRQKGLLLPPGFGDEEEPPDDPPPPSGSTPWSTNLSDDWEFVFGDNFETPVAEGAMFARSGDHARGLGAYANWGAQTYLTTYGGPSHANTGDYYGIDNMSVVSGIAGANGNAMRMRLNPNDGTGKRVGACPYPNISGTPGSSSAASSLLYGRCEERFMATPTARWKTAWLWWPQTWRWTNEIDFPEGGLNADIEGYVHRPNNAAINAVSYTSGSTPFTQWNTVAIEWSPGLIRFILNGVVVLTATGANVASERLFWQLQTENALSGAQPTTTGFVWIDYAAMWRWVG